MSHHPFDRIRAELQRYQETGELPPAWEPEPEITDEEFDRRVDEINREREAIEAGCIDSDDKRHPRHPFHCGKPCCTRSEP